MKKIIALLLVMLMSLFCIIGTANNTTMSLDPEDVPALVPPTPGT